MTRISLLSGPVADSIDRGWSRFHRWLLLLLLLLVALVYWPGLTGGFVFDDFPNIVENSSLHISSNATWRQWLAAMFSSPSSDLQRPLAMLTFAVNHGLTGLDPYWMKMTNVAIHLLNTLLVYALVDRILRMVDARPAGEAGARRKWIALWVASAWALNPINLMAVLFVVQRMESLCHTFVFAGLWLYLLGRAQLLATGRGWTTLLAGLLAGTVLGVLTKESAVLLPLYALALEWALLGFDTHPRARDPRLLGVFAMVLVVPAIIGLGWLLPKVLGAGAYASRAFGLTERLLTELRVLVDYLRWTLLPNLQQLSLYHDDYPVSRGLLSPVATLVSLLILAALFGTMLWLRKRRPLMALGLAWFFAAQLLTATVIPLELMFEHRNYFASLGLMLVLGDGLLRAPTEHWRRTCIAIAILVLAMYAGFTALRASEWSNPMQFSLIEASKHPQSPRATFDVARNFQILTANQSGSPYTESAFSALDRAMHVPGATALPEAAAITLAARTGRPIQEAWWDSLQQKLRTHALSPQETGALGTLVACQLQQKCVLPAKEMSATFAAARARGANAEVLNIEGNYALNVSHDPGQALQLWRQAAEMAPNTVQYQETLARMLIATDQLDEADAQIARIRRIGLVGQNAQRADALEWQAAKARGDRRPPALAPTPK